MSATVQTVEGSVGARVVVVGDVMTDVVAALAGPVQRGTDTPASVSLHGGGSAANTAAWLAHLGVATTFVGAVGADAFGDAAAEALAGAGVACALAVVDAPTGTCVVLVEPGGERSLLPDAGANGGLLPEHLPDAAFRPGDHLHLSGYALLRAGSREAALAALALARDRRMTVSVDAASAEPLRRAGADAFRDWTRGTALLLANADEAAVLTGQEDPRAAAAALAGHYGEVVVKVGAGGALWHGGFLSARSAGVRLDPADVVDTTGAGDAFAAGFLAEWLLHPEPETALAHANRVAARCVRGAGARPPGAAAPGASSAPAPDRRRGAEE